MNRLPRPLATRFAIARWACLAVGLVLAARLVHVQVLQHVRWKDAAQRQWLQTRVVPARRGDLLDRAGRPLALTITSHRIGLSGSLVRDPDTLAGTLADVLGGRPDAYRGRIAGVGDDYTVLARQAFLDHDQVGRLRRFPALNVCEQLGRVYPLDGVGASLLGFYRVDPDSTRHLTGLELGLDDLLAGEPGRAKRVRSARHGEDHGEVVVEPARHGRDVVLTLDADLQEICESRLAATVKSTGSRAGSLIIVDPATGDLLAAASWPVLDTRARPVADPAMWVNRNFTQPYEPGSVFKILTAASLLVCGAVDTTTVFDCSDHHFDGFTIGEAAGHEYGRLAFHEAFARSSNVWFARSVDNMAPREHHRMLLDFGFGRATGARYPGERDGTLAAPADWSSRTQPTIAIGQELAVTPLQLALAVSAVANGGTLHAPRLVAAVRDPAEPSGRVTTPRALRRVLPPGIAAIMRRAMQRVVEDGTGAVVRREGIAIAGKTGTAQKAVPGRGYADGLHTATFAGFLPADQPRLVIVAVLDEPDHRWHYASQSAAPLFAAVVDDIRRTTDWVTDPARDGVPVAITTPADPVPIPDVLFLGSERAVQRLRLAGLEVSGPVTRGEVIMQVPAAGSLVEAGTPVRLVLEPSGGEAVAACPDFAGLSNREVRALASRLGLSVAIEGVGYAIEQRPAAGAALSADVITVTMETPWP